MPWITSPTLFTWAVRDRFVRLQRALPAIRSIPGATLQRFDCGHSPQLEQPEAFAAAVAGFLSALQPE